MTFLVTFSFADYEYEVVRVTTDKRSKIKEIMRNQYGNNVKIHNIEEWD